MILIAAAVITSCTTTVDSTTAAPVEIKAVEEAVDDTSQATPEGEGWSRWRAADHDRVRRQLVDRAPGRLSPGLQTVPIWNGQTKRRVRVHN